MTKNVTISGVYEPVGTNHTVTGTGHVGGRVSRSRHHAVSACGPLGNLAVVLNGLKSSNLGPRIGGTSQHHVAAINVGPEFTSSLEDYHDTLAL